jgi:uncharacterized protein with PQ loop repeat
MVIFFEVISYIAGISLAISAVPRIIVIIKERSVRGVSLFTMFLLMIGNYARLAYGIYHHIINMILFDSISGTLFLIVSLLKIIDKIKQNKNKQIAS